jgi:ATP synthase protein I
MTANRISAKSHTFFSKNLGNRKIKDCYRDMICVGLGIYSQSKAWPKTLTDRIGCVQTPSNSELSSMTESQDFPESSAREGSMEDFYRLQRRLLRTTVVFSAIIFVSTWFTYSLHIALNYLIGACTGVVYLRMLSKNVEKIGRGSGGVSSGRLALVALLILVASQWDQLEIMPVFLGFLTYKAALIGYTIWTAIPHEN